MKMWEIEDYFKMCGESHSIYERWKTPDKCRGLGTLFVKKATCPYRIPYEEMIISNENVLLL